MRPGPGARLRPGRCRHAGLAPRTGPAPAAAAWPPDERPHYEQTITMLTGVMGAADFGEGRLEGGKPPAHEAVKAALAAGHARWAPACRRASGRAASSITSATSASADTRFRAAPRPNSSSGAPSRSAGLYAECAVMRRASCIKPIHRSRANQAGICAGAQRFQAALHDGLPGPPAPSSADPSVS